MDALRFHINGQTLVRFLRSLLFFLVLWSGIAFGATGQIID